MSLDLSQWFETHLTTTKNTGVFKHINPERREKLLETLSIPITEELIMYSILDSENFVLLSTERLLWRCDGKSDQLLLTRIKDLGNAGDMHDPRFEGFTWRYYENGQVVPTNEPPGMDKITNLRIYSPLVFAEDVDGAIKEMKTEPGGCINTILVGIAKLKQSRSK